MIRGLILLLSLTSWMVLVVGSWGLETATSARDKARALLQEATLELSRLGGIGALAVTPREGAPVVGGVQDLVPEGDVAKVANGVVAKLEEARRLDSTLAETHFYLGAAYAMALQPEKAIESLRVSLAIEPKRELTYDMLFALLLEKSDFSGAMAISDAFIKELPLRKPDGLLLRGSLYYGQGNFDAAIGVAKEIVGLDGRHVGGHLLLGYSLYYRGDVAAAQDVFRKTIEIAPPASVRSLERRLAPFLTQKEGSKGSPTETK